MTRRHSLLGLPMLAAAAQAGLPAGFPSQEADVVREVVGVSHFNFARVKELVDARPALAKASWDWGFGDWETALGAASHVGQRETALYLLDKGAPPTIFSSAMLGQLDVVKAFVAASPGIQKMKGPHGLTLMTHARAGAKAAAEVVAYLEALGGADEKPALAPLTDEEKTKLSGFYSFGPGETDRFEVKVTRGQLTASRVKATPRNIFHLGSYVFYPAGADAVRLRFNGKSLTVQDASLTVTAELVG